MTEEDIRKTNPWKAVAGPIMLVNSFLYRRTEEYVCKDDKDD